MKHIIECYETHFRMLWNIFEVMKHIIECYKHVQCNMEQHIIKCYEPHYIMKWNTLYNEMKHII